MEILFHVTTQGSVSMVNDFEGELVQELCQVGLLLLLALEDDLSRVTPGKMYSGSLDAMFIPSMVSNGRFGVAESKTSLMLVNSLPNAAGRRANVHLITSVAGRVVDGVGTLTVDVLIMNNTIISAAFLGGWSAAMLPFYQA